VLASRATLIGNCIRDVHATAKIAMRRMIRVLFVWLLAIAIPVQGLAAVTMLHCTHIDESTDSAHDHDRAAAGHPHELGVPAAHSSADRGYCVDHGDDDAPGVSAQVHKCSACAASNVGMALPSTTPALFAPASPLSPRPISTVVHATFLTSGPERPPRALLA
jgi:hypothetical protein